MIIFVEYHEFEKIILRILKNEKVFTNRNSPVYGFLFSGIDFDPSHYYDKAFDIEKGQTFKRGDVIRIETSDKRVWERNTKDFYIQRKYIYPYLEKYIKTLEPKIEEFQIKEFCDLSTNELEEGYILIELIKNIKIKQRKPLSFWDCTCVAKVYEPLRDCA